jgi:DNA helicase-2/ATP-dependent DNA helicase PcrA
MFAPGPYLEGLNDRQAEAVRHGDGPLLIVAGAGTGKTKTLACRVAHLIDRGTAPERILLLTFTRRAAAEMLRRAARHSSDRAGRVWGGTFHSVAVRLLRSYGRSVGLDAGFTVLDQSDSADLFNLVRGELALGERDRRFPKKETLAAVYSRVVNSQTSLEDVLVRHYPWCREEAGDIGRVFAAYTDRKRRQALLDFDDLLLYFHALIHATGDAIAERFDHILVDEFQDTNALQNEILVALRRKKLNITVVGDDAQAIYSFRAATVTNILEFPTTFRDATIIALDRNYRSSQPILDASNAVMNEATQRFRKDLWTTSVGEAPELMTCADESEQTDAICRAVLDRREQGLRLMDQAVLFRAAHHSAHLEIELAHRNIPFVKYGGLRFLEAAHVKDALALLRILENPRDEIAWYRVLLLIEGVGPARARRAMVDLGVTQGSPSGGPLPAAFDELQQVLGECRSEALRPAAEIERLRRWLDPVVLNRYDAALARIADLEQLGILAAAHPSRGRFVAELTLDPPVSTGDLAGPPALDDDYLVLSTIHSAKGCEWDTVHVIHAADGVIPSDLATGDAADIEEERRLFYVALTRAKRSLHVYFPFRYHHRRLGIDGAHSYAQMSRFLSPAVKRHFREVVLSAPEPDEAPAGGALKRVDELLADLW